MGEPMFCVVDTETRRRERNETSRSTSVHHGFIRVFASRSTTTLQHQNEGLVLQHAPISKRLLADRPSTDPKEPPNPNNPSLFEEGADARGGNSLGRPADPAAWVSERRLGEGNG